VVTPLALAFRARCVPGPAVVVLGPTDASAHLDAEAAWQVVAMLGAWHWLTDIVCFAKQGCSAHSAIGNEEGGNAGKGGIMTKGGRTGRAVVLVVSVLFGSTVVPGTIHTVAAAGGGVHPLV